MVDSRRIKAGRGRGGFTLLEALISLIIFTLITVALALALNAASQTYVHANKAQAQSGEVRAILGSLTRDIQAAYASNQNPVSQFVSGGAASGSVGGPTSGSSDGLLTLTTLTNRIDAPELEAADESSAPSSASAANGPMGTPQSDCALVRYDFDPNTQTLLRTTSPIPNEQILSSRPPGPELTLSKHIQSLTLRFWDPIQKSWRSSWTFLSANSDEANPNGQTSANAQTGAGGQSGATGQTGGASGGSGGAASGSNGQTANGTDTGLPGAVEITLVLQIANGDTETYTTTVPIVAPAPTDNTNQAPAPPAGQGAGGAAGANPNGQQGQPAPNGGAGNGAGGAPNGGAGGAPNANPGGRP